MDKSLSKNLGRAMRLRQPLIKLSLCCLVALAGARAQAATVTVLDANDPNLTTVQSTLATDGTTLFLGGTNASNSPAVFSLPKTGGSVTQLYSHWGTSACCADGVAVVGSNVFWVDPNSGPVTDTQIFSAPKVGGGSITAIYTGAFVGQPIVDGTAITTDGSKLYTTDAVQGRVHSLNSDGSGLVQLGSRYGGFFNEENFNPITAAGGTLFIANDGRFEFADTPPRIASIPAGGGAFTELFAGPVGTQRSWGGIAAIGSTLYLTEGGDILDMPMTGGTPAFFLTDSRFGTLKGITAFDNTLYVTGTDSTGDAAVFRINLVAPAPEPGSAALLASSLGLLLWRRRKSG